MADGVLEFGYDDSAVRTGLANLERQAKATKSRVDKQTTISPKVAGGGALRGIGQASLQFQDIAVQMQAGTKFSTIFAQQAPQLLSAFGPAGMIVGGVAAIGGALFSAGQAANQSFTNMITGADATNVALGRLANSGSITAISDGLADAANSAKAMAAERAKLDTFGAKASTYFSPILGGDSMPQRQAKLAEREAEMAKQKAAAVAAALSLSEQEVNIAKLKADGKTAEVAELEAEYELKKKIAAVEASAYSDKAKAEIKGNLNRVADIEKQGRAEATAKTEGEKEKARENTLLNLAALDAEANGQQKLAAGLQQVLSIRSRMASLKAEGFDDAQAKAIAEQEAALKGQVGEASKGGRIKGANAAKRAEALGNLQAGGLAEFERLQAGGVNERRNAAFGRDKTLSEMVRPGGPMGQLAKESNRRNAVKQGKDQVKLDQATVEGLLRELIGKFEIL